MAKATDAQIKSVKEALAAGKTPDVAVRINFGDPQPIQKADSDVQPSKPADDKK